MIKTISNTVVEKPGPGVDVKKRFATREVPPGGQVGQVLTRTLTGYGWADPSGGAGDWDSITNKPFNKIDRVTLTVQNDVLKLNDNIISDISMMKTEIIDLSHKVSTFEEVLEWKSI